MSSATRGQTECRKKLSKPRSITQIAETKSIIEVYLAVDEEGQ